MAEAARSPLVIQLYQIQKYSNYKFHEVMELPQLLKELLYHSIVYDYSSDETDDGVLSLDDASLEEIERRLGEYKS